MSNIPEYRLVITGEIVATSSTLERAQRAAQRLAKKNGETVVIEAWRTVDWVQPKPLAITQ